MMGKKHSLVKNFVFELDFGEMLIIAIMTHAMMQINVGLYIYTRGWQPTAWMIAGTRAIGKTAY